MRRDGNLTCVPESVVFAVRRRAWRRWVYPGWALSLLALAGVQVADLDVPTAVLLPLFVIVPILGLAALWAIVSWIMQSSGPAAVVAAAPAARMTGDGLELGPDGRAGFALRLAWDDLTAVDTTRSPAGSTFLLFRPRDPEAVLAGLDEDERRDMRETAERFGTPLALNISLFQPPAGTDLAALIRSWSRGRLDPAGRP
ncbi:hypothetical protein [Virgisporangium aliadipatigenens]|nr:hypothetical protein [Virgisporangium aliadipatigenens]